MSSIIRDPGYVAGLAVLAVVIAVSVAFGGGSSSAAVPPQVTAPPTTATAVPTPASSPTPTLGHVLVDARRALDLEKDRVALEQYRLKSGSYPTSDGLFVEFCRYGYEPGCTLIAVSKEISGGDGVRFYWYRSDGRGFTLFAQVDSPPADSRCPAELPPQLAGAPVLCAGDAGGTR